MFMCVHTHMFCLLSISGRKYKKYRKMIACEGAGEGLFFTVNTFKYIFANMLLVFFNQMHVLPVHIKQMNFA